MGDEDASFGSEDEKALAKQKRIDRARSALLKSLDAGDISTLNARVAAMLNSYPQARDSDVVLCLRYWETFQPELYSVSGILPSDLFKLERMHYIVRSRAMIQNELGLFPAKEEIRHHRKRNEQAVKAEILEAPIEQSGMNVFADETGKNQSYVIVAAVWVLSGYQVFKLSQAINTWQRESIFKDREMHFSKLGKSDVMALDEYLDVVRRNKEFLSFKVVRTERARSRRSVDELVRKLHEQMLMKGVVHEVTSGRISLPRKLEVVLDEEDSLDGIAIAEMQASVESFLRARFPNGDVPLKGISVASSRQSALLQLADIVAGAVNRRVNHSGDRNYKCEFADKIIDRLELVIEEGDDDWDASTMMTL